MLRTSVLAEIEAVGTGWTPGVGARWTDRGPWPCVEEGCPESKKVDCDLETGVGTNCLARLGMLFDNPPASPDYAKFVWELCPSKCPTQVKAADEAAVKALTTRLRRLNALHPDDAAAQRRDEMYRKEEL